MSTARWRKVRSDLLSNRSRSLLAIMSLAVGTIAVGAMYLAATTMQSSFDRAFLATNPPSASMGTDPFALDLVDQIVAHPSVGEAEGRRLLQVGTTDANGAPATIELVAMADFADNTVALIVPERGTWPPRDDEIVIERASLGELGIRIGDTLDVAFPGERPARLRVAGSAVDLYEVGPMFGGMIRAYVSMDTITALTDTSHLDALYIRAVVDPLDREQAIATAAALRDDVLAPAGVAVRWSAIQDPSEHRAANAIGFMMTAMQLLSVLALVVAVALVINTVSALLTQQRRYIGVMKTIGATSGQLAVQYLGYVVMLSIIALVIAVPVSVVAGRFLSGTLAGLANFDIEPLRIPWSTIGLQLAIVTVLPVVAVLVSVRRASRLTVQETITDRGISGSASRRQLALPLARPTLLAYRNAVRNRSRLMLTVLTIALCGGILVGVLSTGRSLSRLTDEVAGYWNYDVEIALSDPADLDDAASLLRADASVVDVEGWYRTQAFLIRPDGTENENISITAAPVGSPSLEPTLLDGRWFDDTDTRAIVINSHFADDEPDLDLGDEVTLDIHGRRQEWTVVGVASTTLVGPVGYLAVDELTEAIDEPGLTNVLAVELQPDADADAVARRLESTARAAGLPVGDVQTNAQLRAYLDDLVTLIVTLLLIVGIFLAVVAVVGVAGTMTLSVVEQTREIGVLRTLGASSWAVRRLLLLQGLAIAAAGCVVGVALSIPTAWLLGRAIGESLISAQLPQSFSWLGVGIWVVVALVIGALGATRPARVASRLTIRDTLAYE